MRIRQLRSCCWAACVISSLCPAGALQAAAASRIQASRFSHSSLSSAGGAQMASVAARSGSAEGQRYRPQGWFGSFSQGESTYDSDGIGAYLKEFPEKVAKDGWAPASPFLTRWKDRNNDFAWYHESPSAGELEAYQSHFPPVPGSVAGNRDVHSNPWRHSEGSIWDPQGWLQDYVPTTYEQRVFADDPMREASWFDSSVNQYDGFGRPKLPSRASEFATNEWVERSVNTSLVCKESNCTASVSLQAYNPEQEQAINCRFSFLVTPTDFDGDWSEESVEYLSLNGAIATRNCHPGARGCNASATLPLYNCLREFPVDHMLLAEGRLVVEAKISDMVDECPYEGNLLSGVAAVTCMVRPRRPNTTPEPIAALEEPDINTVTAVLQCAAVSCIASATLVYDPAILLDGGSCYLNVSVNQTDYDQDESTEMISFIALNGVNISTDVSPGANPCKNDMQGVKNKASDYVYEAITNKNITREAIQAFGRLTVTAQNTVKVDECASQGFLLDALVTMRCQSAGADQ